MREIKFRGKRIDNGEWVYGSLITTIKPEEKERVHWNSFIHNGVNIADAIPVIDESVGQYTGLKDKNGKEIYEDDIVLTIPVEKFSYAVHMYGVNKVVYNEEQASFCYHNTITMCWGGFKSVNIIGNIHDNPEMLK